MHEDNSHVEVSNNMHLRMPILVVLINHDVHEAYVELTNNMYSRVLVFVECIHSVLFVFQTLIAPLVIINVILFAQYHVLQLKNYVVVL